VTVVRLVEAQPRGVGEDAVSGEERRADVDGRSGDPQVVGVRSVVQRMTGAPTAESKFGDS
jgi:hypothetical protein